MNFFKIFCAVCVFQFQQYFCHIMLCQGGSPDSCSRPGSIRIRLIGPISLPAGSEAEKDASPRIHASAWARHVHQIHQCYRANTRLS